MGMEDHYQLEEESSDQAREICHQLLCGETSLSSLPQLAEDPHLASEVERRLDACGLTLRQARGWGRWMVTGDPALVSTTDGHGLNTPQLSALAWLLVELEIAPQPQEDSSNKILVSEFSERYGKPQGWNADYLRRAVLGALEKLEYVRVVTPGGQRRQAFITAGPRMSLLDRRGVLRRLERSIEESEAA
jgi:hypothetical protein